MNRIDENSWPVKKASESFAEATVDRLIREQQATVHRHPTHHRLAWLLVAALFISGVALGVALQERWRPASAVKGVPSALAGSTLPDPKPERVVVPVPLVTVTPPLPSHFPTPRKPVRRSASSVPTVVAPTVSANTRPSPKVPPCGCERGFGDYICDCL